MFNNRLENEVYNIIKKNGIDFEVPFKNNDNLTAYQSSRKIFKSNTELTLFTNVPKAYGEMTTTEMVIYGKGLDIRIDCKYQEGKSNLQLDNILGEINRNTVHNKLIENTLMFVIDGDGFDYEGVNMLIRKPISDKFEIVYLNEFESLFHKKLNC